MIQSKTVQAAIESFPKTFGLRAYPGKTFRIAVDYCYANDDGVQIVTEVYTDKATWLHFARSSQEELRREIVVFKPTRTITRDEYIAELLRALHAFDCWQSEANLSKLLSDDYEALKAVSAQASATLMNMNNLEVKK